MQQEQLKERIAKLEANIKNLQDEFKDLRNEMRAYFIGINKLVMKSLYGIIGILLTIVAYFVKMYM